MMNEASKLRVSELDFNEIKNNFKKYLKSQDYFRDFDYEGSTINSLLDILAYSTHYNSFYLNMVANEMFLDSAVLRSSLISLSKQIGYKPRSRTGATANVNLVFSTETNVNSLTVPKNTKIFSTINGINYTFCTNTAYTVSNPTLNSTIFVSNVLVKEGEPLTYRFTVDTSDTTQRFILPNRGIDSSSIEVYVQESSIETKRSKYTLADDILEIKNTSNVYFVEDTTDFYQEIIFGDNVLGRKPKTGNIVIVDYNVCSGVLGNGANSFFSIGSIAGYDNVIITTNSNSNGGNDEESLDSIRFNAPRQYSTQNRAVTLDDYKSLIYRDYPGAQSVVVFGGEDAYPPQFGKVFVGIRPKLGINLSTSVKQRIKNDILKKYNVASITPEFVDIDYLDVLVNAKVKFNSTLTNRSADTIKRLITQSIVNYSSSNLESFENSFVISSLQRSIDNTDSSIIGNDTKILLKKELNPILGSEINYSILFNNPLYYPYSGFVGSVTSSYFSIVDDINVFRENCRIDNDGNVLRVYNFIDGERIIRKANIGSIDLDTGIMTLNNFNPSSITGTTLDIFVMPDSYDINTKNEQILIIKENNVTVEMSDISSTLTTNN